MISEVNMIRFMLAPGKLIEGVKSWYHGTMANQNMPEISWENFCQALNAQSKFILHVTG